MSSPVDRRSFLKSALAALAAAPAATLAGNAVAVEEAVAPVKPPDAPPPALPDYSICRDDAERELLRRQWASALDLVKPIREYALPAGSDPATTFAPLPLEEAPASPPKPAPSPAPPAAPAPEGGR